MMACHGKAAVDAFSDGEASASTYSRPNAHQMLVPSDEAIFSPGADTEMNIFSLDNISAPFRDPPGALTSASQYTNGLGSPARLPPAPFSHQPMAQQTNAEAVLLRYVHRNFQLKREIQELRSLGDYYRELLQELPKKQAEMQAEMHAEMQALQARAQESEAQRQLVVAAQVAFDQAPIPKGIRFAPTDMELFEYLHWKLQGRDQVAAPFVSFVRRLCGFENLVLEIDFLSYSQPWLLPGLALAPDGKGLVGYFLVVPEWLPGNYSKPRRKRIAQAHPADPPASWKETGTRVVFEDYVPAGGGELERRFFRYLLPDGLQVPRGMTEPLWRMYEFKWKSDAELYQERGRRLPVDGQLPEAAETAPASDSEPERKPSASLISAGSTALQPQAPGFSSPDSVFSSSDLPLSPEAAIDPSSLQVTCTNVGEGCTWWGPLADVSAHEAQCTAAEGEQRGLQEPNRVSVRLVDAQDEGVDGRVTAIQAELEKAKEQVALLEQQTLQQKDLLATRVGDLKAAHVAQVAELERKCEVLRGEAEHHKGELDRLSADFQVYRLSTDSSLMAVRNEMNERVATLQADVESHKRQNARLEQQKLEQDRMAADRVASLEISSAAQVAALKKLHSDEAERHKKEMHRLRADFLARAASSDPIVPPAPHASQGQVAAMQADLERYQKQIAELQQQQHEQQAAHEAKVADLEHKHKAARAEEAVRQKLRLDSHRAELQKQQKMSSESLSAARQEGRQEGAEEAARKAAGEIETLRQERALLKASLVAMEEYRAYAKEAAATAGGEEEEEEGKKRKEVEVEVKVEVEPHEWVASSSKLHSSSSSSREDAWEHIEEPQSTPEPPLVAARRGIPELRTKGEVAAARMPATAVTGAESKLQAAAVIVGAPEGQTLLASSSSASEYSTGQVQDGVPADPLLLRPELSTSGSSSLSNFGGADEDSWSWINKLKDHHDSFVKALALGPDGPDGAILWSASADHTIKGWRGGACVATLGSRSSKFFKSKKDGGHTGAVTALAVAPDGTVWSGSEDKTIKCWQENVSLSTYACVETFPIHKDAVHALQLAPDGALWSGSLDQTIKKIKGGLCEENATLERAGMTGVHALAILAGVREGSPYSLFSGSDDGMIRHWIGTECVATMGQKGLPVRALALAPDGSLWSGGSDQKLRRWAQGKCTEVLEQGRHIDSVLALVVDADGVVWSGSQDLTIKSWRNGVCTGTFKKHKGWVCALTLALDGTGPLFSGSRDKRIRALARTTLLPRSESQSSAR
eukprot:jgi/Mesen1/8049/ME000043S07433